MPRTRQGLTMRLPAPGAKQEDWFTFRNVSDSEAEIDIYGQIGGWSWFDDEVVTAQSFRKQLKEFKDKSKITVHINSPGGSVFEGLAIYNALKQHDATIRVVVDALAASAASFIAMAADPDELIMARNAVMMIHDASGVAIGDAATMREMADLLDKHSDNISDIYAQRSGEDAAFWRMAMVEETWYTGSEAVDAGLADSLLEDENAEADQAAAKFDLSIYNYAGRDQAPAPSVIHKRIKAQMKQAKENTVTGKAKNETEGTGPGGETAPAGGTPAPSTGTGAGEEEKTPEGGTATPAGGEGGTPAPAPAPAPAPDNRTGAVTVLINGVATSDPQAIQRHVTALETAASEAKEQGRKDFVAKLATDQKISAGQIESLQTHALSLTDEQWPSFAASWDAAPKQSLLARHGEGTSNHNNTGSPANETEERMQVLEDILAHHRRAGKSDDEIKNMASYKELEALKSANQS